LIKARDGLQMYVRRVCQDVMGEVDNKNVDAQDE
jgi:hypothetical protein